MDAEGAVTQEELASLLASLAAAESKERRGARGRAGAGRVHEARVHDFERSETLSAAVVQALGSAYEAFARAAATSISAYLRTPFEVSLLSLDQLSYEQFVRSVPDPTVAGVFSPSPLQCRGILEINPGICFWIVDHMLGGTGEIVKEPRPFTEMEKALLEGTISRLLAELGTAWQELGHLEPELIEIIDSAEAADIAKQTDAVAVASFEVTVEEMTGMASICLPVLSLKLGRLGTQSSDGSEGDGRPVEAASVRRGLVAALGPVSLSCVVRIGAAAVSASELASLAEGDVVCLDKRPHENLDMLIGEAPRFRCRPVASDGKLAVEIVGGLDWRRTE